MTTTDKQSQPLSSLLTRATAVTNAHPVLAAGLFYLLVTLAVFHNVLLHADTQILSKAGQDLQTADALWRVPAYDALRHGHLLFWNKYLFSGAPFFAESQMAVLYPINWLHLFLRLPIAINLIIIVHVFLIGFWMFLWAHLRGMRFMSSLFCGVAIMFSAPFFLHISAGHMNNLAAMSWVPLMLIAADKLIAGRYASGMLIGTAALALQLLAGQPQYSYYALITLGIYIIANLFGKQAAPVRVRAILAMVIIGASALVLTAIQLIPVLRQASESTRAGSPPSISFTGMFSFAPENVLTALAPSLFGGTENVHYWGRWYLWEMSIFFGVTALVLAVYAMVASESPTKKPVIVVTAIVGLLALGSNTPLYTLLFHVLPGYKMFRGTSKFSFEAVVFLVLLAGMGLDALISDSKKVKQMAIGVAVVAILCGMGASTIGGSGAEGVGGPLGSLVNVIRGTGQSYVGSDTAADQTFLTKAADVASLALYGAAGLLAISAALMLLRPKYPFVVVFLAIVGMVESFYFGTINLPTFPASSLSNPPAATYLARNLGDGRALLTDNSNMAMTMRIPTIWGYDSFNLNRYAEFVAVATGGDPNNFESKTFPKFLPSPLLSLVRLKYTTDGKQVDPAISPIPVMSHIALMRQWTVIPNRQDILSALSSANIDFTQNVVLESPPFVGLQTAGAPGAGPVGDVRLVKDGDDSMEIEGDIRQPCVLLITDSYAAGWHARALAGSSQAAYQLMPADYALRGIPLTPGHQHLAVEFSPPGYVVGRLLTGVAIGLYVSALVWYIIARRGRRNAQGDTIPPITSENVIETT